MGGLGSVLCVCARTHTHCVLGPVGTASACTVSLDLWALPASLWVCGLLAACRADGLPLSSLHVSVHSDGAALNSCVVLCEMGDPETIAELAFLVLSNVGVPGVGDWECSHWFWL